jgi:catechol 2,3-dioxygenase-like lactoylglutathione lyase family enzyme
MDDRATRLHHIGVQTTDLDNCMAWYQEFLGAQVRWSTNRFSDLTHRRLPGITRLVEVAVAEGRLHLFQRASAAGPSPDVPHFQHICLATGSRAELTGWRQRWIEVYESGRYAFCRPEPPTEIVTDERGCSSFYCLDVNGLELEFAYLPGEEG